MRILVVDDEEAGRLLAKAILSSAGHEVDVAADGVEALECARSDRPDVVVSDILMPTMDGYQLAREWKADPELSDVPLIFYTASYTDPADEKFALDLGVDGFLNKPVEAEVLIAAVEEVVARGSGVVPRRPSKTGESEVLREYSERLVNKLEEKVRDLERSNALLEQTMQTLAEEIDVKSGLILELNAEVSARKLREAELGRERDFTRRIIETAHVFIVGLDTEQRIRLFSPGAERISGWSAEEVLGTDYIERFVRAEHREVRRSQASTLLQTGSLPGFVGEIVTRTGEVRLIEWSATVSVDGSAAVDGTLGFGIDVTERMTAAAVERAMARVDLAVLLDRPDSEILDVTCERLVAEFGYPLAFVMLEEHRGADLSIRALSGSLIGRFDDMAGMVAPDTLCPVARAMESGEIVVVSAEEILAGGDAGVEEFGVVEAAAVPLRAHGVTIGAIGLVAGHAHAFSGFRGQVLRRLADRVAIGLLVTEGRRESALRSAALESAASGVLIVRVDGVVTWVNRAFTTLTGYSFEEAVGSDLFGGEDGPGVYREPRYAHAWKAACAGSTWREECENVRADGRSYLEDVTFAPVRDDDDVIRHVVVTKQDLTERREFEQLKSDFMAIASHELRTPLTSVIGYADLLTKTVEWDRKPDAERALASLRDSAWRMKDLVERLLEVAQMGAQGLDLELDTCDVGEVAREVAQVFTDASGPVVVRAAGELTLTRCDRRWIGRAIENLVDNAVKHSPEGGVVEVNLSSDGDTMAISVTDRGEGVPSDRLAGLFEPFVQLDMSSTRRFGGMGIGLFVAYTIVHAHGGTLIAASEPGSGSTFTIRIPIAGPSGG